MWYADEGNALGDSRRWGKAGNPSHQCGQRSRRAGLWSALSCLQGTEAGGRVQANQGLYEALPIVLMEARQKPVVASGGERNSQGVVGWRVGGDARHTLCGNH